MANVSEDVLVNNIDWFCLAAPWCGEVLSSTSRRKWGRSMFSMMKMWSRFARKSRLSEGDINAKL